MICFSFLWFRLRKIEIDSELYLLDKRFACVLITFKGLEVIFDHVDAGGGAFSWLFQTTTILDKDGVSYKKISFVHLDASSGYKLMQSKIAYKDSYSENLPKFSW